MALATTDRGVTGVEGSEPVQEKKSTLALPIESDRVFGPVQLGNRWLFHSLTLKMYCLGTVG